MLLSGSLPEAITGLTSSSKTFSFLIVRIKSGIDFFLSVAGIVSLSRVNPKGCNSLRNSVTLQPAIFDAMEMLVLPAINFLSNGLRSFSNLELMLMIASSESGCGFKSIAILVFALMVIISQNIVYKDSGVHE